MSTDPIFKVNPPRFLGLCKRAGGNPMGWDLIGLSSTLYFPYFPQNLTGLQCVIALERAHLATNEQHGFRIQFTSETRPTDQGWTDVGFKTGKTPRGDQLDPISTAEPEHAGTDGGEYFKLPVPYCLDDDNGFEILTAPAPPLALYEPGKLLVDLVVDGHSIRSGVVYVRHLPPPPIGDEERRAIASQPGAVRLATFSAECPGCKSALCCFTQLNPLAALPPEIPRTAIDVTQAQDSWQCNCGQLSLDLRYLKSGLHELLRHPQQRDSSRKQIAYTPLYEAGQIATIVAQFDELVRGDPREEQVQVFLEKNPIFWVFLAPARIWLKPSVLTQHKADFAVLSTRRVLYLIEIEKPTITLVNLDGGVSAAIQKGADQLREWRMVVDTHRLALLSQLGLTDSEVHEVRYVLVGGLAERTASDGLRKLRSVTFPEGTDFYCFDDLSRALIPLTRELRQL